jgi:DNA polymerase-4
VKIKWANFQISSRSRSIETAIETKDKLHELALELIRFVFPPQKGIRLVGVTLSNLRLHNTDGEAELPFRKT